MDPRVIKTKWFGHVSRMGREHHPTGILCTLDSKRRSTKRVGGVKLPWKLTYIISEKEYR